MASETRIPNGLALDFVPATGGATDPFLMRDATTGLITQTSSIPASRISGAGNLTEHYSSSVLSITGGTGAVLDDVTIQVIQATGSTSGYLSSADWTTFNNKLGTSLASGRLFVGSGAGVATAVDITGDVTISDTGVTAIAPGVIVDADVKSDAAIAVNKLAAMAASLAVVTDGSGFITTLAGLTTTALGYVANVTSDIQAQFTTTNQRIVGIQVSAEVLAPGAGQNRYAIVWDNPNAQWTLSASGGGGTLVGPGSSTDNAITRWNGTGGDAVQNSGVIIDDSNNITGVESITVNTAGLKLLDTDATHSLIFVVGSNLTDNRNLTITTGDASRSITLSGDTTLDDWFDQSVKTTADVVFGSATLSNAGGLHILDSDSSHDLIITTASDLAADRTLTINTGDASRSLTINTSGTLYITGGTDVALADGGTGASLSDPNYDAMFVWDDTAGLSRLAIIGSGLSYDTYTNTIMATLSGAWLLSSGGLISGANTITSNAKNQLLFDGTWTATAANDYHLRISPSITGQGATNPNAYRAFYLTPSFTAGDNSQTFTALSVDATFDDNAKTGVIKQLISLRSAGTSRLSLSSAGDLAVTGNTHTFNAASGGTVSLKASAILDVNSDTSYVLIRGRGTSTNKSVEFNTIAPLGDTGNVWQFTGTTFSTTGAVTQSLTNIRINPTYSAANAGATSTIKGIHYSPTETVLGTFTHYAFLIDTPTGLSGFGTATPNARVDIRGINNSTALLVTDDGGNVIINFGESGGNRVIGLFGSTPVGQLTSGANLTNNVTSGGTDDQIDNWTDLSTYATDAAAIRNAIYQLSRKLKQINDGLRLRGDFN